MRFFVSGAMILLAALCAMGCGEQGPAQGSAALRKEISHAEGQFQQRLQLDSNVDWADPEVQTEVSLLLRLYAEYANAHHGDSLAARFLMRRADLLQGRGDPASAVSQWLDVVEGYPNMSVAPEAMFRMGFTQETLLLDTVAALRTYTELVSVFPESKWAEQAGLASKWLTFDERHFIEALNGAQ